MKFQLQQQQQQQQHQQMVQQMINQQSEQGRRLQQQQQLHQTPQHAVVATKSKPANILGAAISQAIPMIQQQQPQQGIILISVLLSKRF